MNRPVSSLNLPQSVVNKLEKEGFCLCDDVKENFEAAQAKVNICCWPSVTTAPKLKTALELCREELNWKSVTTFIPELDDLLRDEVVAGAVTELTGFPGSGKTQVCFHLSVGVSGEVVFICTNRSFSPERVKETAEKFVGDAEPIMKKIQCIEAMDVVELLASVSFLENWLSDGNCIRLLIIDSISWPLKQQTNVQERTSLIYTIFQNLRILANRYKFAIVVTNDLTTRVTGGVVYNPSAFSDGFYHIVNTRMLLSREGDTFNARIVKSAVNGCQTGMCFKF